MIDTQRVRSLILALWNEGDTDAIDELYAKKYVGHDPHNPLHGPGDVREWHDEVKASAPDFHIEIHDMVAEGDIGVSRWTASGTDTGGWQGMPATGKSWTVTGMTMSKFEDGKIVESWANADNLGLMQQIGLVPETA